MSWAKIDDQFPDHPKVQAVGPLAGWLWVCGLCYSCRYLTDGKIAKGMAKRLADVEQPEQLAAMLVAAGLWEDGGDHYIIHDFHDYNPTADEVKNKRESISNARSEAGKRGAEARWQNSKRDGKSHDKNMAPSPSLLINTSTASAVGDDLPKSGGKFVYPDDFDRLWDVFPKPGDGRDPGSKKNAYNVWRKLSTDERAAAMSGAIRYAASADIKRDGGRFIKTLEPWLRGRRWETVGAAPRVPDSPPDGYSWEKDGRGQWITLGGNRITTTGFCYGATDILEESDRHKEKQRARRLEVMTA